MHSFLHAVLTDMDKSRLQRFRHDRCGVILGHGKDRDIRTRDFCFLTMVQGLADLSPDSFDLIFQHWNIHLPLLMLLIF